VCEGDQHARLANGKSLSYLILMFPSGSRLREVADEDGARLRLCEIVGVWCRHRLASITLDRCQ
jgi:hypothetical protein